MSEPTKPCRKCGTPKPRTAFAKNKGMADGHINTCKDCHNQYTKKHYQQNEPAYVAKAKQWQVKNPERAKQLNLAHVRRYTQKNRKLVNHKKAIHKRNNRAYYAELENRRRARKLKAFVAPVDRREIYERDCGKCHICKRPVAYDKMELDHVIPLARGGEHSPRNVAVAHPRCNRKKWVHLI